MRRDRAGEWRCLGLLQRTFLWQHLWCPFNHEAYEYVDSVCLGFSSKEPPRYMVSLCSYRISLASACVPPVVAHPATMTSLLWLSNTSRHGNVLSHGEAGMVLALLEHLSDTGYPAVSQSSPCCPPLSTSGQDTLKLENVVIVGLF